MVTNAFNGLHNRLTPACMMDAIGLFFNFWPWNLAKEHVPPLQVPGQHQEQAGRLHDELRTNLLENIAGQYRKTGYLWENYRDDNGMGQGSHPFTGWTALVVLIAGEAYFSM